MTNIPVMPPPIRRAARQKPAIAQAGNVSPPVGVTAAAGVTGLRFCFFGGGAVVVACVVVACVVVTGAVVV